MSQVLHARLFRNHPQIRWEHRVHEQIVRAIERSGGKLEPTDIAIVHVGYTNQTAMTGKMARNLRLIDIELEATPFDLGLLQARAVTLLGLGRNAEALVTLSLCEPGTVIEEFARNIFALRGEAYAAEGQLDVALDAVRTGLSLCPRDTRLCFLEAQILGALGHLQDAERSLRGQLIVGEEHGRFACADRTVASFRARHLLAEVLLEQGLPERAEMEARAVVAARSSFGQGWLTLGETLIAQSKQRELEELCEGLGASADANMGRTLLHARQCAQLGQHAHALSLLEVALLPNPRHLMLLKAKAQLLQAQGDGTDLLSSTVRLVLERDPLCVRTSAIWRKVALATLGRTRPLCWSIRAQEALGPLVPFD
ncbi:MAG: hypothetical protein ACLP1X_21610 [Polyangiaceae bacterium]